MIHFKWPTAGRRPRRTVVILVLTALVSMLLAPGFALAVHDFAFQLDGDVSASTDHRLGQPVRFDRRQEIAAAGWLLRGSVSQGLQHKDERFVRHVRRYDLRDG